MGRQARGTGQGAGGASSGSASGVSIADAGLYFTGSTVEEALAELGAGLTNDASNIEVVDAADYFTGEDVEAILAELDPASFTKSTSGGADKIVTITSASGATSINLATGNVVNVASTAGNYTLSVTGLTSARATSFILILNTTTTGHTPTWFANITWIGGLQTITWTGTTTQVFSFLSIDGTNWYGWHLSPTAPIETVTFSYSGVIVAGTVGVQRIYNDSGETRTIVYVRYTLGDSPATSSSIADVNENGTTIFAAKPTVAAAGATSKITTIDSPTWEDGNYLTVDFDTAGDAGSAGDATVVVGYRQGS